MIYLEHDQLEISCPEVHDHARCSISFQRTLRIPDDGRDYPLPPGLGCFPLRHLDDYADRLQDAWVRRGGVIMPMFQAEAMWLNFGGYSAYPFALKIATGKVCAITGEHWVNHLNTDPQDYLVLPEQPWLDGYCVEKGVIRQFVAMPLGKGYTVEEQVRGAAQHGGLQITAYPMKAERYEAMRTRVYGEMDMAPMAMQSPQEEGMGLAPGGRMRQEIYEDDYGLDAWDQRHPVRCFVTIANSAQWMAITGERPPKEPPTAQHYTESGLPWYDYYDADHEAVTGSEILKSVKGVAQTGKDKGETALPDNESITGTRVVSLRDTRKRKVREYSASESQDS